MIEIKVPCSFAAYDASTKKLESSIVTIGVNTSICCFQDELKDANKHILFTENVDKLITDLNVIGIKNNDGTELTTIVK
ncbi:MAG TPA: hypothetical protein VI790_05475 [Candidatus Nanoarchaeia archaeon]|nr:hypothetical protein [Candidatus Nanoarchaeia archaeon]